MQFDGRELFTANDPQLPNAGTVAFWSKSESATFLDSLDLALLSGRPGHKAPEI